jgi:hypothetical protein
MAVFKQVNIRVALRKIMSDLGYTQTNSAEFPWQDSIEWIGEALGQIGAYTQYNAKEVDLVIKDYKSKLPCDFIHLKRIVNADYNSPQGILDNRNNNLLSNNMDSTTERGERYMGNSDSDFDYNIVLDNIITTVKDGNLKIQYLAMPTDEEGFPLIPDNESYKEAFFWKVARQLSIRGKLPNERLTVEYCDAQWQWYCGQARAEANHFTHAEMDWIALDNQTMAPLMKMTANNYENNSRATGSFENFMAV